MTNSAKKNGERLHKRFLKAFDCLTSTLGTALAPEPIPISTFTIRYREVLEGAEKGKVHRISLDREQYVLLTESQLVEIMEARLQTRQRSLADTLASVTPPKQQLDTSLVTLAGSLHDPFVLPGDGH